MIVRGGGAGQTTAEGPHTDGVTKLALTLTPAPALARTLSPALPLKLAMTLALDPVRFTRRRCARDEPSPSVRPSLA